MHESLDSGRESVNLLFNDSVTVLESLWKASRMALDSFLDGLPFVKVPHLGHRGEAENPILHLKQ